jgi:hypothetical protein
LEIQFRGYFIHVFAVDSRRIIIHSYQRKVKIMLKKITLAFVTVLVLSLSATVLFAQGPNIDEESIQKFLVVYADPAPEAIAKATADIGDKAQDFALAVVKITTIHQLKKSGLDGDALKTQLAALQAPMAVTAAELDVYNAHEAEINPILEKLTQPVAQ